MCCNPVNGRVDIEEWVANKTQVFDLKSSNIVSILLEWIPFEESKRNYHADMASVLSPQTIGSQLWAAKL